MVSQRYCLAVLGFKLSLLASYHRLAGFNQTYRWVLYIAMVLVTLNQLIYTFLLSCACRPIAKQWDPSIPGTCIHQLDTYFGLGGSSLGFDVLIIVLPFPILQRLQLNLRKKLLVGAIFATGFFLTAVQAVRVRTIAKLANYTDSEPIIDWSIVEINVGVLVASAPACAPLLKIMTNTAGNVAKKVSYHSRSSSRSTKRQSKTLDAEVASKRRSMEPGQRGSKVLGIPPPALVGSREDHDETALWAKRRGWGAETYGWSDVNATSDAIKAEVRADGRPVDEEAGVGVGLGGRDAFQKGIVISHSVNVSRDMGSP